MNKLFYITTGRKDWIDIAKRLDQKCDWKPVYWLTSPKLKDDIRRTFPNVIFHSTYDANRGIQPKETVISNNYVLDSNDITQYSQYEHTVLRLMDRFDPGNAFSFDERIKHYHKLLKYWIEVIKSFNPDIAIFANPPHPVAQYILYAVCKEHGVITPQLVQTSLPEIYIIRDNPHKEAKELDEFSEYISPNANDISDKTQTYLKNKMSDTYEKPHYMKVRNKKRTHKIKNLLSSLFNIHKATQTTNHHYKF